MDCVKLASVKGVKAAVSAVLAYTSHVRLSMQFNAVADLMCSRKLEQPCHVQRGCGWTFMTRPGVSVYCSSALCCWLQL